MCQFQTSVSADPKSHTPILMADEYKEPQKQGEFSSKKNHNTHQ